MKKVLAILLASLMLLTVVPFAAFAKVEPTDAIVADIRDASKFRHISYVAEQKEFKTERIVMTVLPTYDDAWVNAFTDSKDVSFAKALLLNLIEQVEAEYRNKTFEKILNVLDKVQQGVGIVEKIDSFTHVLNLAENSNWGTALNVLSTAINLGKIANDYYEKYVEAYAKVISIQSSSIYYAELLDHIIANVSGAHADTIKTAARDIKATITMDLNDARNKIILELIGDAAKQGIYAGIDAAMQTNAVTAVIDKIYDAIGLVGKKVFNTEELYEYMTCLAELVEIEGCVPAYVDDAESRNLMPKNKVEDQDYATAEEVAVTQEETAERAWDFAIHALAVMRETGEELLKGFARSKSTSKWNTIGETIGLWGNTDEMNALINDAAVMYAKSHAWRMVIDAEKIVETKGTWFAIGKGKNTLVKDKNDVIVGKIISETPIEKVTDKVALYAANDADIGGFVKVIIPLEDGMYTVQQDYVVGDGSSSSSSSSSSGGFGSIFSNLFKSIGDFFKSLFSIFKF